GQDPAEARQQVRGRVGGEPQVAGRPGEPLVVHRRHNLRRRQEERAVRRLGGELPGGDDGCDHDQSRDKQRQAARKHGPDAPPGADRHGGHRCSPVAAVSAKCQPNRRRSAPTKTALTASPISPDQTAIAIMTDMSPVPLSVWAAKAPMPPIPVPMSSTATATTNPDDAATRTPVAMNGAALGSDTRRATPSGPKPKERSVSLASGSTLLTP